jgi:hypothetical protein
MRFLTNILAILAVSLTLASCSEPTDEELLLESIGNSTVRMDNEQVVLTQDQVNCGTKEELWEVSELPNGSSIARLTPAGRKFFADDLRIGDAHYSGPVAPLVGSHKIKLVKVTSLQPPTGPVQTLTGRISAVLEHECFSSPVPIMGIAHGTFSERAEPILRVRNGVGEQIIH